MNDSERIAVLLMKVGELERKLEFVMQTLKLEFKEDPLSPALVEATKWLQKGNKIEAIKVYQQMIGGGLKDSKDAVDALERKLGGK